jgi:hypothetical protein
VLAASVNVANELSKIMFMSAHVNDMTSPNMDEQALTGYTKVAVIEKKNDYMMGSLIHDILTRKSSDGAVLFIFAV